MGFLRASSTVSRFHAPPPSRIDRAAVAQAVSRRTFREADAEAMAQKQVCGWVGIHDPLAVALDPTDLFFQQYLVVGFRFDRRAVPAKLLWLERRRLEEARKAERGLERLGAAARREIKDEIEARLLTRALPVPGLFDCAWNLDSGHVYFSGKARAPRDAFADLFKTTFGVALVPLVPYVAAEHVGLPSHVVEALRAVEPSSLVASNEPDIPHLRLEAEAPAAP